MSDEIDRAQEREQAQRSAALASHAWQRQRLAQCATASHCAVCEAAIPLARQHALPGVQTCVDCQCDLESALARGLVRGLAS